VLTVELPEENRNLLASGCARSRSPVIEKPAHANYALVFQEGEPLRQSPRGQDRTDRRGRAHRGFEDVPAQDEELQRLGLQEAALKRTV
jgi:hypothetical protein